MVLKAFKVFPLPGYQTPGARDDERGGHPTIMSHHTFMMHHNDGDNDDDDETLARMIMSEMIFRNVKGGQMWILNQPRLSYRLAMFIYHMRQ